MGSEKARRALPSRFSYGTTVRAVGFADSGGLRAEEGGRWTVPSREDYRVQVIEALGEIFATCTCPNGRHRGGTANCWHAGAAIYQTLREK